ncbi:MAG: hypothetical protein JXQ29_06795 [Planctomycetes bacterium]|nr:hypothetical protein [Planctomycetota bacterium]
MPTVHAPAAAVKAPPDDRLYSLPHLAIFWPDAADLTGRVLSGADIARIRATQFELADVEDLRLRAVLEAAFELYDRGEEVTFASIYHGLRARGHSRDPGGPADPEFLFQLAESVPHSHAADVIAADLHELARRRRMRQALLARLERCADPAGEEEVPDEHP